MRGGATAVDTPELVVSVTMGEVANGVIPVHVELITDAAEVAVTVNGVPLVGESTPTGFVAQTLVPEAEFTRVHSEWRGAYGAVVVALARSAPERVVGEFVVVGGVA